MFRWPTCSNNGKEERAALRARVRRQGCDLDAWPQCAIALPRPHSWQTCSAWTQCEGAPLMRPASERQTASGLIRFCCFKIQNTFLCPVLAERLAGSCDAESLPHSLRSVGDLSDLSLQAIGTVLVEDWPGDLHAARATSGASNPGPPGATPVVARIFLGIVRRVQRELSGCPLPRD